MARSAKKWPPAPAAFDMQIAYHSRSPKAGVPYLYKDSPLALAEWADIFVVAVRADATNRHTVNRALLAALGHRAM